jgi:hypothetical protein
MLLVCLKFNAIFLDNDRDIKRFNAKDKNECKQRKSAVGAGF